MRMAMAHSGTCCRWYRHRLFVGKLHRQLLLRKRNFKDSKIQNKFMWPTAARRLAAELRNINPLFTRWQIINTEYQLILEVKSFYSDPGRGNVGFFLLNGTFRLLNAYLTL